LLTFERVVEISATRSMDWVGENPWRGGDRDPDEYRTVERHVVLNS